MEPSPIASADARTGDFASSDGRYRLRADASWKPHKAKDARCVLSLASERAFAYLYVEKKIDLVAANLDAYVDSSLEHKRAFKNVATKNPVLRATVGGRPARETELDFEEDGYRWRELYTVVEFEDEYVEISIVAKPSKYAKSVFQHLVQGLSATPR